MKVFFWCLLVTCSSLAFADSREAQLKIECSANYSFYKNPVGNQPVERIDQWVDMTQDASKLEPSFDYENDRIAFSADYLADTNVVRATLIDKKTRQTAYGPSGQLGKLAVAMWTPNDFKLEEQFYAAIVCSKVASK